MPEDTFEVRGHLSLNMPVFPQLISVWMESAVDSRTWRKTFSLCGTQRRRAAVQSVRPLVDAFRLQAFLDAIVFLIDAYAYFVIHALHCLCVFV